VVGRAQCAGGPKLALEPGAIMTTDIQVIWAGTRPAGRPTNPFFSPRRLRPSPAADVDVETAVAAAKLNDAQTIEDACALAQRPAQRLAGPSADPRA